MAILIRDNRFEGRALLKIKHVTIYKEVPFDLEDF